MYLAEQHRQAASQEPNAPGSSRSYSGGSLTNTTGHPNNTQAMHDQPLLQSVNVPGPNAPLPRNRACLSCRRRKLKCDAGKPHCKACLRTHQHALRTGTILNPILDCQYDTDPVETVPFPKEEAVLHHSLAEAGTHLGKRGRNDSANGKRRRLSEEPKQSADEEILSKLIRLSDTPTLERYMSMIMASVHERSEKALPGSHNLFASPDGGTDWSTTFPDPSMYQNGEGSLHLLSSAASVTEGTLQFESSRMNMQSSQARMMLPVSLAPTPRLSSMSSSIPSTFRFVDTQEFDDINQVVDVGGLDEDNYLRDVFYPGWSRDLPEPMLMDQVIETFFAVIPICPHIFNRTRFLLRMTLPPTHHDFPFSAILHAMCASTARYVGGVYNETIALDLSFQAPDRPDDPRLIPDFGRRHAGLAKEIIERNLANGQNIYPCAQALAVLMHHFYSEARWLDGWMGAGSLARLLVPLGLTQVVPNTDSARLRFPKSALLNHPVDDVEKHERRNLVWCAAIMDVGLECSSGWPGALLFDEVTIPLPSMCEGVNDGDRADMPLVDNDQTVHSPDLWMRHTVVDGFSLYVKACLLARKINRYVRSRRVHNDLATARDTEEFRDLDAQIATFILAFPPELRDPLAPPKAKHRRTLDHDLMSTQMLLHFMSLRLHEPFADYTDNSNPSTRRMLAAARGVLKLIYLLSATSYDLRMISHGEFSLLSSCRALIEFLKVEMKTRSGVCGTQETLEAEIEVFRTLFATRAQKFPIGLRMLRMLEAILAQTREEMGERRGRE